MSDGPGVVNPDDVEFYTVTDEDIRKAMRTALDECGCTLADLERQYRRGYFDSDLEHRTHMAFRHFGHLAPQADPTALG